MMRYLSARIVPGVNPPAGMESDKIKRLTCGGGSPEPPGGLGDPAPHEQCPPWASYRYSVVIIIRVWFFCFLFR